MSKIGRISINLPQGVRAELVGETIRITGPKGTLERLVPRKIEVNIGEGMVNVKSDETYEGRAFHGTTRAHIANMVKGVSEGWKKQLELVGAGYRAEVLGNTLSLNIGYSQPVKIEAPEGIVFKVEKSIITVEGVDKDLVGQVAANIRGKRPPEPYKGKGIRYLDEVIRRKPGKAAKAAEGVSA